MGGWLDRLAHAPDPLLIFVAVLAAVALMAGFSNLRRVRHIEDVPTARVRSAPQGYVELIGTAHMLDGEPIVAPLSNTRCCWFRYKIERRSGKDWKMVQSGSSDGIFVLRDDTGDCVIDPEGAEVTSRHERTWSDDGGGWRAHAVHMRLPSLGKTADLVVDIGGKVLESLSGIGEYRYQEAVILDGDTLYAVGRFRTLGPGDRDATLDELTGAILREWKRRPDTLRERFDGNRDGHIDADEWQRARATARREAAREYAENMKQDQLHTLSRPSDGRYFLLSNLEQFGLLRRYRWRMRFGFGACLLLGGVAFLMLSTRL
ncbi:MAG: E3 ubiquitin ligase family protein [Chromatiaceae bacterium]|nr:E3 ubiquitin ligase family protein [Chromatiaceae bacterium]